MEKFAERVTALMNEKKLTQKDVSRLSGVSEASLCRYLKGVKPRMDIVFNVAKVFNVTPNYLMDLSDELTAVDPFTETKTLVARNCKILTEEQKLAIIKVLFEK